MKGKTAIIGDGDSVLAFRAVGMDAYGADHPEKARNLLKKLAKTYHIILITDVLAKEIDDTLAQYASAAYPVIIPVPSGSGGNGYGDAVLRRACEKALGVNILSRGDKKDH